MIVDLKLSSESSSDRGIDELLREKQGADSSPVPQKISKTATSDDSQSGPEGTTQEIQTIPKSILTEMTQKKSDPDLTESQLEQKTSEAEGLVTPEIKEQPKAKNEQLSGGNQRSGGG